MSDDIFLFDIRGTLDQDDKDNKQMKRLIANLEKIKILDKVDKFHISLISSDHMDDILKFVNERIRPCINKSSIEVGPIFSSSHIFTNNGRHRYVETKGLQIKEYLEDKYFTHAYYSDDALLNNIVVKNLFDKKFTGIPFECFALGSESDITEKFKYKSKDRHISTLNELVEKFIFDRISDMRLDELEGLYKKLNVKYMENYRFSVHKENGEDSENIESIVFMLKRLKLEIDKRKNMLEFSNNSNTTNNMQKNTANLSEKVKDDSDDER